MSLHVLARPRRFCLLPIQKPTLQPLLPATATRALTTCCQTTAGGLPYHPTTSSKVVDGHRIPATSTPKGPNFGRYRLNEKEQLHPYAMLASLLVCTINRSTANVCHPISIRPHIQISYWNPRLQTAPFRFCPKYRFS